MDELKKIWGNLEIKASEPQLTSKEIKASIHNKSKGVLDKLRKNVRVKMYYAVFFTLAFSVAVPFIFPLVAQVLMVIMIAAYLVGTILLYQELQVLNTGVDMSQNLLSALITYRNRIKRVLRYEEVVGLCLYPVSITACFLFGLQVASPKAPIMHQNIHWIALVTSLIIFTIGGNWLAKWMNRKAFGKYLDELDNNIEELYNQV